MLREIVKDCEVQRSILWNWDIEEAGSSDPFFFLFGLVKLIFLKGLHKCYIKFACIFNIVKTCSSITSQTWWTGNKRREQWLSHCISWSFDPALRHLLRGWLPGLSMSKHPPNINCHPGKSAPLSVIVIWFFIFTGLRDKGPYKVIKVHTHTQRALFR